MNVSGPEDITQDPLLTSTYPVQMIQENDLFLRQCHQSIAGALNVGSLFGWLNFATNSLLLELHSGFEALKEYGLEVIGDGQVPYNCSECRPSCRENNYEYRFQPRSDSTQFTTSSTHAVIQLPNGLVGHTFAKCLFTEAAIGEWLGNFSQKMYSYTTNHDYQVEYMRHTLLNSSTEQEAVKKIRNNLVKLNIYLESSIIQACLHFW